MKTATDRISALRNRLQGIAQLRPADYVDAGRAAVCLLRVALSLGRQPFPRLLDRLGLSAPLPAAGAAQIARAVQRVRWAHNVVPVARNCLLDSLAAAVFLRQQGLATPLAIGVCRQGEELLAHAWLGAEPDAPAPYRVLWRSPAVPR